MNQWIKPNEIYFQSTQNSNSLKFIKKSFVWSRMHEIWRKLTELNIIKTKRGYFLYYWSNKGLNVLNGGSLEMLRQGRDIICWWMCSRLMSITGCWSWQGRTSIFSPTIFRGIQRMRPSISGESPPPPPGGFYLPQIQKSFIFPNWHTGVKWLLKGRGPKKVYTPPLQAYLQVPSFRWLMDDGLPYGVKYAVIQDNGLIFI